MKKHGAAMAGRGKRLPLRVLRAYPKHMAQLPTSAAMNWKDCPLVEVIPGKVSGVPLLKGTRLPADTVLENYEGGSPVAEIAENFDVAESTVRALLKYAASHASAPAYPAICRLDDGTDRKIALDLL